MNLMAMRVRIPSLFVMNVFKSDRRPGGARVWKRICPFAHARRKQPEPSSKAGYTWLTIDFLFPCWRHIHKFKHQDSTSTSRDRQSI